ncbi:MAG: marine proteobacterial sortase target protein [Acidobacteriota bacterium]
MDNKARDTSSSPGWLESLLLVLFTLLALLLSAARSEGRTLALATDQSAGGSAPQSVVRGLEALGAPIDLDHARAGSLLLRTSSARVYLPAPVLETEVELRVTGFIDCARVRQRFHNPTSVWVEGVYVFPLPEGAAVDTLRMTVGERVIEGVVQERQEAKQTYEAAKREGRKASLVEQERLNIFTTSVANLGPGEDLDVEIEYQEELRYDAGRFELRFPLVVAPRYVPGRAVGPVTALGWSPNTTAVAHASRITPPVADNAGLNPVKLRVDLDPGFTLESVTSPSHRVTVEPGSGTALRVTLADTTVPADRDFVLDWQLAPATEPRAAVFTEDRPEGRYALLMIVPPLGSAGSELATTARLGREEIFVVDTSGSMAGASIRQAKDALRFALSTLKPDDRFNIIQFNSGAWRLFDVAEMAFPDAMAKALAYVDQLQATGGTEMAPALQLALGDQESPESPVGRLRQVVFMTDGSVGNEDELFTYIHNHLGESRLFTVGIGSAPNSHFLRRAAEFGRGTFTYVGSPQEVAARMGALFRKLGSPALTDLEASFDGQGVVTAETWPSRVPDVYLGEPVTIAVRLSKPAFEMRLRGVRASEPWEHLLALSGGAPTAEAAGIEKLWARRKIGALLDGEIEGQDPSAVKSEVTAVALEHHLVSPFTSLVAVDVTPTAPTGQSPRTVALPVNLPAGWVNEAVWGEVPQTATPRDLLALVSMVLAAIAVVLRRGARS